MRLTRATILTAAAIVLTGCDASRDAALVRTDSAGIQIVTNRGPDRPADVALERVFSLGGADAGPEAFFNIGPGAVQTDAYGRLYVLDRGNHRITVFDWEGRHLRTLSRRGGGPGELQWPQALAVLEDGGLAVADIGHRGLVRFDPAGAPMDPVRLENWRGGPVRPFGGGLLVQLVDGDLADEGADRLVVMGHEGSERELARQRWPEMRPVDLGCVQISGMSRLFDPTLVWSAGAGRAAYASGADYDIRLHDGDRLVASIRRDLPPRPATRALAIQEVGETFRVGFGGGGGCEAPPERVVDERGFAPTIPALRSLAVAPDGTTWARRFAVRGEPAPIDLFAADGEYLGTLPGETPFPATFRPDGSLVTVEKDEMELDHVVVYRVIPAGTLEREAGS